MEPPGLIGSGLHEVVPNNPEGWGYLEPPLMGLLSVAEPAVFRLRLVIFVTHL